MGNRRRRGHGRAAGGGRGRGRASLTARLPRFDRRARRHVLLAVAAVIGYVVAANLLVRTLGGGAPNLLSPLHHADKAHALSRLGLHSVRELGLWPHPDARAAVTAAARRNGVAPALALSVADTESGFDPHAISHTGAMGLMQLMPGTAGELGVGDPFDPARNADAATRYLRALHVRYAGQLERVVAAYNAGPGRVPVAGELRLPAETRNYVRAVLRRMASRQSAATSKPTTGTRLPG